MPKTFCWPLYNGEKKERKERGRKKERKKKIFVRFWHWIL